MEQKMMKKVVKEEKEEEENGMPVARVLQRQGAASEAWVRERDRREEMWGRDTWRSTRSLSQAYQS